MTQIFYFTSFGWSIRMNPLMHPIQEWWFGHLRFPLQDCNYILHRDATSYASLRSMRMIFPKFPSRCWQQEHRDIVSTKMLHNVIRTWGYTHILYCIWRPWGYKVLLVKYEFDKTFYACLGRAESVFQNSRQFDHREHTRENKQYCLKLLLNKKGWEDIPHLVIYIYHLSQKTY
jgi:hypothetical protein